MTYLRYNQALVEQVDAKKVLSLGYDLSLKQKIHTMTFAQLSMVYWLCRNFNSWDAGMASVMEAALINLLKKEIAI